MSTLIWRHRRENLKKCSLKGLESRPDLRFITYPTDPLPDLSRCLVLQLGAPPLTLQDAQSDILLIDGTWRLAQVMLKQLPPFLEARSLPGNYLTAYPRRQTDCPDPRLGLASIEALYIAHLILGRSTENLLDGYHWQKQFLYANGLSNTRTDQ